MRTPLVVLLLLAAGCTKPAPVAPAPPQPAPATAAPAAAPRPAAVTCADAGVLLRGTVDDQKQAGPAKEAVIARTCKQEQWPAEILGCFGDSPEARPCLARLTPAQRTAYDYALVTWHDAFPDEMLEEAYEGDDDLGMDAYIDCTDAIQDVTGFSPAVTLTGDARAYVLELRKDALLALCEDWPYEARACFRDLANEGRAGNAAAVDACRAGLEAGYAQDVTDKLAELDRLGAKVAALKKNAASHDCRKVVAAHYADAAWKGKIDAVKGAARAKAIAESRQRMTKACTDDKWSPNMRACIVAGGGAACFTAVSASAWSFPAVGVVVPTGIPECDAYAATMKAVDACTAFSQSQRDAFKRTWSNLNVSWASTPPERRASTATSCKTVDESMRRVAANAGCKI
jgi:hypothetical protein